MTGAPAFSTSGPGSGEARDAGPIADTTAGRVRGSMNASGTVACWRGIPYAAPPVGPRRFASPEPAEPWAGVRDATTDGRSAVQPPGMRPGPLRVWLGARRSRSEDCLVLNIWAPRAPATPRPVVVWIHGGSFTSGAASGYDGAPLVEQGDIVFVAINYRLGGLGFVNLHDASGGDERIATNPGLRDQIAALQWVHDNIAAFGGDSGRVTIAGESAGSASVSLLLSAATARGLVHGAIAQSGALTLSISREDAARVGRSVLDELGVSRERIDELWRRPASAILAATLRVQSRRRGALVTRPWWDDDVLPSSIGGAYASVAPVPLMIGANRHEHRTFTRLRRDIMPLTRPALATALTSSLGWDHAARVLDAYPDDAGGLNDLGSDLIFGMPSIHLAGRQAEHAPVWSYRFDYGAGLLGFGALHGIELQLLFAQTPLRRRLLLGPESPALAALQERFRGAWLAFVRGEGPGGEWPRYDAASRSTRIWDLTDRVEHDPGSRRRLAWAGRDVEIH